MLLCIWPSSRKYLAAIDEGTIKWMCVFYTCWSWCLPSSRTQLFTVMVALLLFFCSCVPVCSIVSCSIQLVTAENHSMLSCDFSFSVVFQVMTLVHDIMHLITLIGCTSSLPLPFRWQCQWCFSWLSWRASPYSMNMMAEKTHISAWPML